MFLLVAARRFFAFSEGGVKFWPRIPYFVIGFVGGRYVLTLSREATANLFCFIRLFYTGLCSCIRVCILCFPAVILTQAFKQRIPFSSLLRCGWSSGIPGLFFYEAKRQKEHARRRLLALTHFHYSILATEHWEGDEIARIFHLHPTGTTCRTRFFCYRLFE